MRKEAYAKLNNIQQKIHNIIKFNRSPPITLVPKFQHREIVGIACNTKFQQAKFYHKNSFSPSI